MAGRLSFAAHKQLHDDTKSVSILNPPNGTVYQAYIQDGKIKMKSCDFGVYRNYNWTSFGNVIKTLPYNNVVAASLKSFPQYGTYAAVSYKNDAGMLVSTIVKDF